MELTFSVHGHRQVARKMDGKGSWKTPPCGLAEVFAVSWVKEGCCWM